MAVLVSKGGGSTYIFLRNRPVNQKMISGLETSAEETYFREDITATDTLDEFLC